MDLIGMKRIAVWGALLAAGALAMACGKDPNVRIVEFPKIYYELGILYSRDAGSTDPKAWVYMVEANGKVKVPNGKELELCAAQDVKTLEALRTLGAGDLHTVDFNSTNVTDAKLAPIGHLTGLKALNLSVTPIGDAGLEHLAPLASLEELSLRETLVTDAGLERLKPLKSLKKLDLRQTRVTEAGAAELKTALPGCEVEVSPLPATAKAEKSSVISNGQ